jgi:apolipoprotein D and lipocalin family protein
MRADAVTQILLAATAVLLAGCQTVSHPPIALAPKVDLARFMGDWYVIANIPTFLEKSAHNAVESYRLAEDGTIETTFTFRAGSFDGEPKRYTPRGFVFDRESNAVWGMQFIWPIKADFRIVYLTEDYSQTVIGREARDYVWIMARTPSIPEPDYRRIVDFLAAQGYDTSRIQKVPQRWAPANQDSQKGKAS